MGRWGVRWVRMCSVCLSTQLAAAVLVREAVIELVGDQLLG